jgi:hypothetical protein
MRIITSLTLLAALAAAGDLAEVAERLRPSFVTVEYTLRFDKGEEPRTVTGWTGGLAAEERPLEMAGIVVAPDRVVTMDPMYHPRFVERVEVRFGNRRVAASAVAHLTRGNGVVLALQEPLPGIEPIEFGGTEARIAARYGEEDGTWRSYVSGYWHQAIVEEGGRRAESVRALTLLLDGSGKAVGISFADELPADGSWKGTPLEAPSVTADEVAAKLADLKHQADRNVLRVELNLRSPKTRKKSRFDFLDRENDAAAATELNVPGLLLDERTILVLADIAPKVTARLERVRVHVPGRDPVAADFRLSLKHHGGLLATLHAPLPGPLALCPARVASLRNRLLLAAEVVVKGEERAVRVQTAGFDSLEVGWRKWLHPDLGRQDDGRHLFLFDVEGRLVAIPLRRRAPLIRRSRWDSGEDPKLYGAAFLRKVLADPDAFGDPANVPVAKEQEGRLAWMGVVLQRLTPELARASRVSELTSDGKTGAVVSFVYAGSPAERVDLRPGDILLRLHVEDRPRPLEVKLEENPLESLGIDLPENIPDEVRNMMGDLPAPWPSVENAFTRMLTDLGAGTKYVAEVFRDGEIVRKRLAVEWGPDHFGSARRSKSDALGLTVRNLTFEVRRHFQLAPDDPGVIASKVERGGKAAVAGIRVHEIITQVDDQPVGSVEDFERLTKESGEHRLLVKHRTETRAVKIVVPQ